MLFPRRKHKKRDRLHHRQKENNRECNSSHQGLDRKRSSHSKNENQPNIKKKKGSWQLIQKLKDGSLPKIYEIDTKLNIAQKRINEIDLQELNTSIKRAIKEAEGKNCPKNKKKEEKISVNTKKSYKGKTRTGR